MSGAELLWFGLSLKWALAHTLLPYPLKAWASRHSPTLTVIDDPFARPNRPHLWPIPFTAMWTAPWPPASPNGSLKLWKLCFRIDHRHPLLHQLRHPLHHQRHHQLKSHVSCRCSRFLHLFPPDPTHHQVLKRSKRWNISRSRCKTLGRWKRSLELQKTCVQADCNPLGTAMDCLLYLVGATCISPGMRFWTYGIRPCSITPTSSQHELYSIRPSAMRLDATIFIPRFLPLGVLKFFQLFDFFRLSNIPSKHWSYLTFAHRIPFNHRSSLAMPHPKQRSHYSQVFYVVAVAYYRCRQILTSERKSWRSVTPQAPPHPRTCSCQPPTPTPPTLCSFQRSMACEIRI